MPRDAVKIEQGQEPLILHRNSSCRILHLDGSLGTVVLILAQTPFQTRDVLPVPLSRALLILAVLNPRRWDPHLRLVS